MRKKMTEVYLMRSRSHTDRKMVKIRVKTRIDSAIFWKNKCGSGNFRLEFLKRGKFLVDDLVVSSANVKIRLCLFSELS